MDSLRKRLNFSNPAFQLQVLRDLQKLLENKLAQLAKSQQLHLLDKVPELDLLVSLVASDDEALTTPAVDILCSLVFRRCLDSEVVLSKLMNSAYNARDLSSVCRCLSRILIHVTLAVYRKDLGQQEQTRSAGSVQCSYGEVHGRLHPFIGVLTSRPTCHFALVNEVQKVFTSHEPSVRDAALQIMGPFLKYVLLNPELSSSAACQGLQDVVAGLWTTSCSHSIREFILCMIPAMPCDSPGDKTRLSVFVAKVAQSAVTFPLSDITPSTATQLFRLIDLMIAVCDRLGGAHASNEVARAACMLLDRSIVQVVASSRATGIIGSVEQFGFSPDHCLLVIARLLLTASPLSSEPLVSIALLLLTKLGWEPSSCLCSTLVLPLLAVTSLLTAQAEPAIALLAAKGVELLRVVEAIRCSRGNREAAMASSAAVPELHLIEPVAERMLNEDYSDAAVVCLVHQLEAEPTMALPWLRQVISFAEQGGKLPASCLLLVAAIVHWSSDEPTLFLAVDAAVAACAMQPDKAHGFVSVMLYKLRDSTTAAVHLALLTSLPRLASHKFTASVVTQALSSTAARLPGMQPIVLRLLTRLWIRHDRMFAVLLDMLTTTADLCRKSDDEETADELTLSRAACASDVCQTRPHERGPDVLPILSDILNSTCSTARGELACSLALDGIRILCEKEVVNLRSVWSMLEPLLARETRHLVLESVCRLLAVASATGASVEQDFAEKAVTVLWDYALGRRPASTCVVGAAYSALSSFTSELTKYWHLPPEVVQQHAAQAYLVDPDTGFTTLSGDAISADCIVPGLLARLQAFDEKSRKGFGEFLAANVNREIANLPRSMLSRYNLLKNTEVVTPTLPKAITSLPSRLMAMHKVAVADHKPSLGQSSHALLFCFDPCLSDEEWLGVPASTVGTSAAPAKARDLVIRMRAYEKALQGFISNVVSPSGAADDWQRSALLPSAWQAFMTRTVAAMVAGRQAELSLQIGKSGSAVTTAAVLHPTAALASEKTSDSRGRNPSAGHTTGAEDVAEQGSDEGRTAAVLHWSRTRLHDLIRTAGRVDQNAQANAMLAHAALCSALIGVGYALGDVRPTPTSLGANTPDDSAASTTDSRGRLWLRESLDALIAAAGGRSAGDCSANTEARGVGTVSWWPLANEWPCRGSACLALAHAAAALQCREPKRAVRAVSLLCSLLSQCRDSQQKLFCSTALGRLLCVFVEQDSSSALDFEVATEIWRTVDVFEQQCLEALVITEKWPTNGAVLLLGFASCAAAIAASRQRSAQMHCRLLLSKLRDRAVDATTTSRSAADPAHIDCSSWLRYCLAAIASPLIIKNALTPEESKNIADLIVGDWLESAMTNATWAAAIGITGHTCLSTSCSSIVFPTVQAIVARWESISRSPEVVSEQRAAAVSGLLAISGYDDCLLRTQSNLSKPSAAVCPSAVDAIVSIFEPPASDCKKPRKGMKELSEDVCGLYWRLGQLHWAESSRAQLLAVDARHGPASYRSLLPTSSILRSVVETLRAISVHGPDSTTQVKADAALLLTSLDAAIGDRPLPPMDWLTLLSPFMYWPIDGNDDDDAVVYLEETCLRLACKQSHSSHACASFLTRWCAPPLFKTLKIKSQNYLLRNLHKFCNVVPRERIEEFLKQCCLPAIAQVHLPASTLFLQSCKDALADCTSCCTGSIQLVLYQSIEAVYTLLPAIVPGSSARQENLNRLYAECLLHMEDAFLEQLLLDTCAAATLEDISDKRKRICLCLSLVSLGRLPIGAAIASVESVAELLKLFPASWLLEHLAMCFGAPHDQKDRMDWFLKFCKSIVTASALLRVPAPQYIQCLDVALCIVTAAAAEWSEAVPWHMLFGSSTHVHNVLTAMAAMPQLVVRLVSGREPWSQIAPKVFEWLLDCRKLQTVPKWQASFRATILGLRRCSFFQKQQLWERIAQTV